MTSTRRYRKKKPNVTVPAFKLSDFSSGDGFVTKIWGPMMWFMLHIISFNYPVHPTAKHKADYRNFVLSLANILPCGLCRSNLSDNFAKCPLTLADMANRDAFSRYIYKLHEIVNDMLEKPSTGRPTYDEVRELYENFRSRCTLDELKRELGGKHNGCTEPLNGKKSRCIISVVPQTRRNKTLTVDKKCIKRRARV